MAAALIPLAWITALRGESIPNIGLMTICAAVGLLPDIDTAASVLGRLIPEISEEIEKKFGHRTITHSALATLFIFMVSYLVVPADYLSITLAYLSHLIIDMMVGGRTGIAFFWPIERTISFTHIEPASRGELIIGAICAIAIVAPLAIPPVATGAVAMIPTQPTAAPISIQKAEPVPSIVAVRVENVHDMDLEIIVEDGQEINQGQKLADLSVLRAMLMMPTPTATPTYFLLPTLRPQPTPTPTQTVMVQPTQDFSKYHDNVSSAAAALALAEAQGTAAAAHVPPPTQTAVCRGMDTSVFTEEINTAHQQIHIAKIRYDELNAPPPVGTVTACLHRVEDMKNDLWSRQLSRDAQVSSNPDMSWHTQKALEAPLLAMEGEIDRQEQECSRLEAIPRKGSDIEIASAQAQRDAAELRLVSAQRRYEQATQDHQEMIRRCQSLTVWPHQADQEAIQVSAARLEVAYTQYRKAINTPTLIPSWTPTKTPTWTPTPTPTPTATATPDLSDTEIYSPYNGTVHKISPGTYADGRTTVVIEIIVGYGEPQIAESGVIVGTGDIQAMFTKTGIDIEAELVARIEAATESIDATLYEFNLDKVAHAMIEAHQRGVEVRVKADDEYGIDEDTHEGHGQFAMLMNAGIEVREDNSGHLMHNKFWIFDSGTVWTGSTNITKNGTQRNNNNVIVFNSPQVAIVFQREFDEMWRGSHGKKSPSTLGQQDIDLNGVSVRVVFGPEDKGITQLVQLVKTAKESIHFLAFSYTHDDLGIAMVNASVPVMGIFEVRGSKTEYSELARLHCAGSQVRTDGNPATFHHKAIIIDSETVATGSFNFSKNADQNNDENYVIVRSPEIAKAYLDEFQRRWSEAETPTDISCR